VNVAAGASCNACSNVAAVSASRKPHHTVQGLQLTRRPAPGFLYVVVVELRRCAVLHMWTYIQSCNCSAFGNAVWVHIQFSQLHL
jgi:hypothetical protein